MSFEFLLEAASSGEGDSLSHVKCSRVRGLILRTRLDTLTSGG